VRPLPSIRRILIELGVVGVFFLAHPTEAAAADEIVFGEYGSLTGSEANFGQSTHNGVMMAVEDVNATGGILGKKLRVVTYDDQGKTAEVGTAVTRLVTRDQVTAVIGEVASSLSLAGGQICQQHGVPMVSPSSTNPKVTEIGDYVFRVCFVDPFQGYAAARFITDPKERQGLDLSRVALLVDQRQAYSQGLAKSFIEALAELGGEVVANESYQGGDQDFSAQLSRIKEAAPEVLYVPGYYTDVANVAKQARAFGITAPFVGGDGWESVQEIAAGALDGSYYTNHYAFDEDRPAVHRFVTRYRALYHHVPDSLSALGYDSVMLLRDAIIRTRTTDHQAVRDALAKTRGFEGVTGKIIIDAKRNAVKPAVVLEIQGHETHAVASISPEPTRPARHIRTRTSGPTSHGGFSFPYLLQLLIKGISVGSLYALLALGYTMVYGILRFINFAHSDVFMLGAFFAYRFALAFGFARPTAVQASALLLLAMAACALCGFLIERLAYRPLRRAPRLNVLITAIGVSLFIENAGQLLFGKTVVQFPTFSEHTFLFGGVPIRTVELIAVTTAAALMLSLQTLVFSTKIGRGMRAVAFDHNVAGLMGVPIDRVVSLTFIIGSVLAAAAGLLVGVTYGQLKQPADSSWVLYGLKAFVAAVIGGIGNLPGAMLGGLVLGLSEQLVAGYLSTTFRDAIAFGLLILILLVRPSGLLGTRVVEKV
jgi:branched-chain amino acid transport system substrate-binding protein